MFELGERSLQGVNDSITMTLPATWIKHHDLHKQDRVNATVDDDGRLILTPIEKAAGD
jgi:antitoxin component of MazEF toxin-antitoxin module